MYSSPFPNCAFMPGEDWIYSHIWIMFRFHIFKEQYSNDKCNATCYEEMESAKHCHP